MYPPLRHSAKSDASRLVGGASAPKCSLTCGKSWLSSRLQVARVSSRDQANLQSYADLAEWRRYGVASPSAA